MDNFTRRSRERREKVDRAATALYDKLNPNWDVEIKVSKAECIRRVEQQRGERRRVGRARQLETNMTNEELKDVGALCNEIADLGRQIEERRKRALAIVQGMVATRGSSSFRITSAKVYFGGANARVFFEGPFLKKDGSPHARSSGSGSLELLEKIERR